MLLWLIPIVVAAVFIGLGLYLWKTMKEPPPHFEHAQPERPPEIIVKKVSVDRPSVPEAGNEDLPPVPADLPPVQETRDRDFQSAPPPVRESVVVERVGTITRAGVIGDSLLNNLRTRQIGTQLLDVVEKSACKCLILDVKRIENVSTTGLDELMRVYQKLKERDGELLLLNPTREFRELLEVSQLNTVFPIFHEEEEPSPAANS